LHLAAIKNVRHSSHVAHHSSSTLAPSVSTWNNFPFVLVSFSSPQDAAIVTLLLDSACDVAAVDLQVLFSSLAPCLDFCVLTEIEMLSRALCLIFFYYRGKLL